MKIETLRDVFGWTTEFHQQLSLCLEHCASESLNVRAAMLLEYLARHERKLTKLFEALDQSTSTGVLDTWCYEYLEKKPILQHKHCDKPLAQLDIEQIMDVILEQHSQVIELYKYLHARAETTSVKDLLENLSTLEEREAKLMSQGANRLHDM